MHINEMDMHVYFYIIQAFNVEKEALGGAGLDIKQNIDTLSLS